MIFALITWFLLMVGCYFILSSFFGFPKKKFIRVSMSFNTHKKISMFSNLDNFMYSLSKYIKPLIRLSVLKQLELKRLLDYAQIDQTPEEYVGYTVVWCIFMFLLGLPLMIIFPALIVVFACISIFVYFDRMKYLKNIGKKTDLALQMELPSFTAYISQSINTNSDAISLLSRYKTDCEYLRKEIDITLADIKTSNFENALSRLDLRVHNDGFTKIINGLMGIYHGDNVLFYFQMLERDFTTFQVNLLKKTVKKIPDKLQMCMLLLTAAIMFIFMTPFIILLIENYQVIFSS